MPVHHPSHNMGGSVNLKTRNAFTQKGRRIRLDANLSLNTAALEWKESPGGERTPDRKIKPGIMLAYSRRARRAHPAFSDTVLLGILWNCPISRR